MGARNATVVIANEVAGVLRHACHLPVDEAAEIGSLAELGEAFAAAAKAYNAALAQNAQHLRITETPWAAGCVDNALGHRTQSGRLTVWVEEGYISLAFEAGPAKGGHEGREVLHLGFAPGMGRTTLRGNWSLIEGRLDRIAVLWEIDDALGGLITRKLEACGEEGHKLLRLRNEWALECIAWQAMHSNT